MLRFYDLISSCEIGHMMRWGKYPPSTRTIITNMRGDDMVDCETDNEMVDCETDIR